MEVTWFDGQLDAVKQRAAIDNMASQDWDFVAIQAFGIGTLTQPVQAMIDKGTPVIDDSDAGTIAARVEELVRDPGLAVELGATGRARVRRRHLITHALEDELRLAGSLLGTVAR